MHDWRPSADLVHLRQRAKIIQDIRHFFQKKSVLEVETPLLAPSTTTDPNIESFSFLIDHQAYYLQTSPEFHMKRLLASGSGPIFQISKAFRKGEFGIKHNPEFTMLEWYQPGFSYFELMDEVEELLKSLLNLSSCRFTYREIFQNLLQIDPFNLSREDCLSFAKKHQIDVHFKESLSVDDWLDLWMTQRIEPLLKDKGIVFIYDYPPSQAALSQIRHGEVNVAERFEVYVGGTELANGFQELIDPVEQLRRFQADRERRKAHSQNDLPIDHRFLAALEHLPPSAGVAMGIDRLLMFALNHAEIRQVQSFSFDIT